MSKSVLHWNCKWQGLPESVTVGQELLLRCEGSPVSFKKKNLKISVGDKDKYKLHLLEVEDFSSSEMHLVVTSYKVGSHKIDGIQISDGQEFVDVNPLSLKVSSVIKGQAQSQPYGPMGPLALNRPSWYWPSLAVILILIMSWLFWRWRRSYKRKRAIESLATHQTSLSPYNQFNKDFRALERRWNMLTSQEKKYSTYLHNVEEVFRMYLVRELSIPAKEWKNKEILSEVRRKIFLSQACRKGIGEFLLEMARLSKREEKDLTKLDGQQMSQLGRRLADQIHKESQSAV